MKPEADYLASQFPLRKEDKIEMSRYINLEVYHRVESTHPFYGEMIEAIHKQITRFGKGRKIKILELGAGTGLLTRELLKHKNVQIDAIELDQECCEAHEKYITDARCQCICDNAVTFCQNGAYDIVVSAFAHDHIAGNLRVPFSKNIKANLKPGGVYVMGGEILPFFSNEEERKEALYTYHCYIIEKALRDKHFEVAQIEINALKSGLEKLGDFKRHEGMFEEEMASSGLRLETKEKIGPLDLKGVGGVFVYVYQG